MRRPVKSSAKADPAAEPAPLPAGKKPTINDIARLAGVSKKTVSRVLNESPFVQKDTRERVKAHATSVWLRADLETLVMRTLRKRGSRPLLNQGDPRDILARLMTERYPIYALADYTVETQAEPHEVVVDKIMAIVQPAAKEC